MNTNKDQLQQIVFESVSETFEAMIFTPVAPVDPPDSESSDQKMLEADVDSVSPVKGKMTLQIPSDLALDITKDIFGWMEDQDPEETMIRDTLAELINTIAGRIMTRLIPENESFELGLPGTGTGLLASPSTVEIFYFMLNDQIFSLMAEGDMITEKD